MKKYVFAIILSWFTLFAVHAFAQGHPMEERERDHHEVFSDIYDDPYFLKNKLSLTDDQIINIKSINSKYREKYENLTNKIHNLISDLRILSRAKILDADNIRKTYSELCGYLEEERILRMSHFLEIEKILTREQSKKLRSKLSFLKENI
jgi:hypothetical protein